MNRLGRKRLVTVALAAYVAGNVASCGGRTSFDATGADASVDASIGGTGGGGTGAAAGTGATGANGGTGANGANGGTAGSGNMAGVAGVGGAPDPCTGVYCKAPAKCLGGACYCPGDLEYCNDVCVDTQSSVAHCGVCNHACDPSSDCVNGQCQSKGACDPVFCPTSGFGTPCCITPSGPCGTDLGSNCIEIVGPDGGP